MTSVRGNTVGNGALRCPILTNRLDPFHTRKALVQSAAGIAAPVQVESHQGQNRRVQVLLLRWLSRRLPPL